MSLHVEAQIMMEELNKFEGDDGLVFSIPEPPSHKHDAWTKGVNRASGSRSLRIVMPLAMALEIVQHAISGDLH